MSDRPLRVALYTESYLPVVNGVTTSVRALAVELRHAGHLPTIIAPHFSSYTDDTENDLPVIRLRSWRTPLNRQNPFAYPPTTIPQALKDIPFDIVHTQHPFGIGLHARQLAKARKLPLIATFHTLYHEYAHYLPFLPSSVVAKGVRWWLCRFYSRCQTVIAPSQFATDILRGMEIAVPITVIPTGIPNAVSVSADTVAVLRSKLHIDDGLPILLYVGRLAPEKNLDLLLAMMKTTNAHLLIIGGGSSIGYPETLRRRTVSMEIGTRIIWMGSLPNAELPPFYSLADIFVFPSPSETQGIVLGEALSYGLPCVAVKGGGASESVRDNIDAFVVENDAGAFADAVHRLIADIELRNRFGRNALDNPQRRTPEMSVQNVLDVYSTALSGKLTVYPGYKVSG